MNNWIYIGIMFSVTFLIRVVPMTLIRREIKSKFIKSFLYYVPYVTLAVMTCPAIIEATDSPIAGIAALILGVVLAGVGAKLFTVAVSASVIALVLELISKVV